MVLIEITADVPEHVMVAHAERRGRVMLAWGTEATLVRWKGHTFRVDGSKRNRCDARIDDGGIRRSVKLSFVTHMIVEDSPIDNPNEVG